MEMLRTLFIIHRVKLLKPFSQHKRDKQGSSYCHSFVTIIWTVGSKKTPVGLLYAEKMTVVVLLNVLWIGFSASPLFNTTVGLPWRVERASFWRSWPWYRLDNFLPRSCLQEAANNPIFSQETAHQVGAVKGRTEYHQALIRRNWMKLSIFALFCNPACEIRRPYRLWNFKV